MLSLPNLSWKASPNYSSRQGAKVRLCVIHDCEGSYGGSASWFAMARSQVSAHIVLSEDGNQAVQMVAWANKAWAVCNFNPISESYEAAGFSAKGLGAPEWQALAAITAFRLRALGLPPVYARGGDGAGFCQHADLGAAGGGHHDVTADPAIWNDFVALVQSAYAGPQPGGWSAATAGAAAIVPASVIYTPSTTQRHDLAVGTLEWCQMRLNALGYASPSPLVVDGIMGPATERAVAQFQAARHLLIDGDPGPQTAAALAA